MGGLGSQSYDSEMGRRVAVAGLVSLLVIAAGASVGYASGRDLQANATGWTPDGAAPDTFWESQLLNLPGVEITDIHCHGRRTLDFQYGATHPARNPCYPGNYDRTSGWGVMWIIPGTDSAVYQSFVNGGAYSYSVESLLHPATPPVPIPNQGVPAP